MAKQIPLTKGLFALVDDSDFDAVSAHSWFADGHGEYQYAKTRMPGARLKIRLHRFLLNAPSDMVVDHIDGNTLNNCRSNLRICTAAENTRNKRRSARNTTGYAGVAFVWNRPRPYRVRVRSNGAIHDLGYFADPAEAARAYDAKAIEVFGQFARLNFPSRLAPMEQA